MIKVNLVPADILAKAAQRQLMLQAAVVGGLFVMLMVCVSFGHWYGKHSLEQTLAYDEAELQRLDAIVKQVEELEKAANAVRSRLNVIEDLLRGRSFYPVFMSEFARTVPPGVRVAALATASQPNSVLKLSMSAVATTNDDIAAWIKNLEKAGKFTAVELGAVTNASGSYTFSLTALYTSKP